MLNVDEITPRLLHVGWVTGLQWKRPNFIVGEFQQTENRQYRITKRYQVPMNCTCVNNIKNTADQYGYTEEYLNHSSYNDNKYILISNKLVGKPQKNMTIFGNLN